MTKWRLLMRAFILSATALLSMAAAPAFAHGHGGYGQPQAYSAIDPSCESDRRTSRNVGGFLGALGGASAGRAIAAAGVRPEGVILGTVVGAIVGSKVGSAAVDCSPRPLYTQQSGRSYGAGVNYGSPYQAPQPVYYGAAPNYNQAPVYQPPVYQQPVYQAPAYQPPVYQQPVYQAPAHQYVAGEDWYQPSPQSYYGQERRGPLVAAPPAYGRPDYVPADSYVAQQQQSTVVVTQTYQAGGPVYAPAPVYAPPSPQYAPNPAYSPVLPGPAGAPCGYYVCR
jgi:hypothetical protein